MLICVRAKIKQTLRLFLRRLKYLIRELVVMKIAKNNDAYCSRCGISLDSCFCFCPFCGDTTEDCSCNAKSSKNIDDTILSVKSNAKLHLFKRLKTSYLLKTKDDDWWRLEKWQFGRRRFP